MTRLEALRILGLKLGATPVEVKTAYRELVKALHPDKNPAPKASHLFQLVQEAYECIATIDERANMNSDRAERAAGAWTERKDREAKERARADKEARERATEKEAQEELAKAQREWQRQRTAAATKLTGAMANVAVIIEMCMSLLATCSVLVTLGLLGFILKDYPIGGIAILIVIAIFGAYVCFVYYFAMWRLPSVLKQRLLEYQLRKFEKNHPPPSKGASRGRSSTIERI